MASCQDKCLSVQSPAQLNKFSKIHGKLYNQIQLEAKVFNPPDIFPLISIVNRSCNIERCVKSMRPIFQNKIVSQGLERILSIFRRTTMSGQPPLS